MLTPADFHELSSHPEMPILLYNLIFSDQVIQGELYQLLFHHPQDYMYAFSGLEYGRMKAEFDRIWEESEQWQEGSNRIVLGAVERILIDLVRRCETDEPPMKSKTDSMTETAIRSTMAYIQFHFRGQITLEDAAKRAQLSPNYFSQCFRRFTGVSFQTYLLDLRLEFANWFLSNRSPKSATVPGLTHFLILKGCLRKNSEKQPRAVRLES